MKGFPTRERLWFEAKFGPWFKVSCCGHGGLKVEELVCVFVWDLRGFGLSKGFSYDGLAW